MKTFKEFVKEEVPTNSASSGAVAAIGVGQNGEPPKKLKHILMLKRKKQ
jgi:hypothetical protein